VVITPWPGYKVTAPAISIWTYIMWEEGDKEGGSSQKSSPGVMSLIILVNLVH
jgi:hypothetical protein